MYKKDRLRQLGLTDFNQPIGLKMNPENRWVKKAELIPWPAIEDRSRNFFPVRRECLPNLCAWLFDHLLSRSSTIIPTGNW